MIFFGYHTTPVKIRWVWSKFKTNMTQWDIQLWHHGLSVPIATRCTCCSHTTMLQWDQSRHQDINNNSTVTTVSLSAAFSKNGHTHFPSNFLHPPPPPPSVYVTDIQSAGGLQVWLKTSSWSLTQHIYGGGRGNFERFYLKTKCETRHQENVNFTNVCRNIIILRHI